MNVMVLGKLLIIASDTANKSQHYLNASEKLIIKRRSTIWTVNYVTGFYSNNLQTKYSMSASSISNILSF